MRLCNRNECNINPTTRIYWRASLVSAAAVTPAHIAYIKVAAVKKLVVGSGPCSDCRFCSSMLMYAWVGRYLCSWLFCCVHLSSGIWMGLDVSLCPFMGGGGSSISCSVDALNRVSGTLSTFTLNKFECSKQAACCLKILAWNNRIGLWSYFVGLIEPK